MYHDESTFHCLPSRIQNGPVDGSLVPMLRHQDYHDLFRSVYTKKGKDRWSLGVRPLGEVPSSRHDDDSKLRIRNLPEIVVHYAS